MSQRKRDQRGNSDDRARRKRWMVNPDSGFGGDGKSVPCYWCNKTLRLGSSDLTADRWPICGHLGGTYKRDNLVPSCKRDNSSRCNDINHRPRQPWGWT